MNNFCRLRLKMRKRILKPLSSMKEMIAPLFSIDSRNDTSDSVKGSEGGLGVEEGGDVLFGLVP